MIYLLVSEFLLNTLYPAANFVNREGTASSLTQRIQLRRTSLLERLATQLGCRASWKDERLLRRSAQEDRRSRGERDAQVRSRSHLRRGHLLRQALRGDVGRGEVAGSARRTPCRHRRGAARSGLPRSPCRRSQ